MTLIGKRTPRERKHALAGHGPIVDRARQALRMVATQFGEVISHDDTTVSARTADGIDLTLSYEPGNFVFSRVYNLTVTASLPEGSGYPTGLVISHQDRGGPRFVKGKDFRPGSVTLSQLNDVASTQLKSIDVLQSTITGSGSQRSFSVTPMGGSYVWVLIPPVFKATTFPPGEPERVLDLIRSVRHISASTV